MAETKHWSKVEYLHETVRNPNIHVRGTHSYYSPAWSGSFEESAVRYHYGDAHSLAAWTPKWAIDQLHIGDYVCIGPEAVILMGGNNTHRADWISCYPFADGVEESYESRGDTVIDDGAWIGMRAMLLPGVRLGEGAVVGAGSVVTKAVRPYAVVAGNPAREVCTRFPGEAVERILALKIYDWPEEKFSALRPHLCGGDVERLEFESVRYDTRVKLG